MAKTIPDELWIPLSEEYIRSDIIEFFERIIRPILYNLDTEIHALVDQMKAVASEKSELNRRLRAMRLAAGEDNLKLPAYERMATGARTRFSELDAMSADLEGKSNRLNSISISHNTKKQVSEGREHSARLFALIAAKRRGEFPKELYKFMNDRHLDPVFLVRVRNRRYILKVAHNKREYEYSLRAADMKVGPRVYGKSHSLCGQMIAEEYLTPQKGWRPIWQVFGQIIRGNKRVFIKNFATCLERMHREGMLFMEDLVKHTFINLISGDVRIIDYGDVGLHTAKEADFGQRLEAERAEGETIVSEYVRGSVRSFRREYPR